MFPLVCVNLFTWGRGSYHMMHWDRLEGQSPCFRREVPSERETLLEGLARKDWTRRIPIPAPPTWVG